MRAQHHYFLRRFYLGLVLSIGNLFLGVVGFMIVEGYNVRDALFTTLNILSTVGIGLVKELSPAGRWFFSFMLILSIGIFAYGLSVLSSFVMEGDLSRFLIYRRLNKKINALKKHVIVCGYGRNGQQACEQLKAHGQDFLVIERNEKLLAEMKRNPELIFLEGDATREDLLEDAGIKDAAALITTLPDDASNVFVVLTARELNPKLKIISRASENSAESKLRTAGANNVIMPDKIGGTHMASLVTKPDVMEFVDIITGRINFRLEEISIENLKEKFKQKTVGELEIHSLYGANVVGLKLKDGQYIINPSDDTILTDNSKLFVLCDQDQMARLQVGILN